MSILANECHLYSVSIMLSVANKPIMLSASMLNVILLNVTMLNVVMLIVIMLIVIMLNVIILNVLVLSVVAPLELFCIGDETCTAGILQTGLVFTKLHLLYN